MAKGVLKVVELPSDLRQEAYLNKLELAIYRLMFRNVQVCKQIESLKKEKRTSTRIYLSEDGETHLSILLERSGLSIVDAITVALFDIHTNRKIYFVGETTC